jgi:replicative DNA helicase
MTLSNLEKYGIGFQIKVLSSLLTHKEFLLNIQDVLSDEYFTNQAHKWIIKEILRYFTKYHTCPSMDVLKVELKKIDNEVLQLSIKEQLREAYKASDEDLKYVEEEFSNFCKNQQLKKALLTSVDFLNAGDYDSIRSLIDNALRSGQDKNLGHEYNKDTESRYREDHRTVIPTPWKEINDLLQGGLGNGDFGLIFGNPGGGKSWSLVALGGYAVSLGYNVLHYTLELGSDYVGRRYDAFFTGIGVQNIAQHKDQIEAKVNTLQGQLIIKEFPPGKASVSTIESHIKKCEDLDFKADLIIIDYVDLLRSKKTNRERKDEIDDIYVSTKGLARELNLPVWSVSQVNRSGAKDNIIEGDKAAGSYDKMMITDVAISLSRKKEDKVNGTGRLHIMKNRYGMDGLSYYMKVDTSTGHFQVMSQMDEDDEQNQNTPPPQSNQFSNNISPIDKSIIQQRFFELSKTTN